MRRQLTRRALVCAGALFVLMPGAEARAADTVKLSGRYRFSGGQRERRAIDAAIEDIVRDMSFAVRPIARRRLKAATRVAEKVRIHIGDDTITIALESEVYTGPADGTPIKVVGDDGEEIELRMRVTKSALEQTFNTGEGGRDNSFRRHGAKKVRLAVRIHSDKLPRDLEYELTYRRQ